MKNLFILLNLFGFIYLKAQENTPQNEADKYLQKSIKQRKTANILAITGGGIFVTGLIITGSSKGELGQSLSGLAISSLGVITSFSSIPFYISSNSNNKKYLKIKPSIGFLTPNYPSSGKNYNTIGIGLEF